MTEKDSLPLDTVMQTDKDRGKDKLELIASKHFTSYKEMYKIVDFLNKNLKHKKVMFGLTKNTSEETMTISIYEV